MLSGGNVIEKREARLYWIRRLDKKGILIFDAGYKGGDIYIYERKESVSADRLGKLFRNTGNPPFAGSSQDRYEVRCATPIVAKASSPKNPLPPRKHFDRAVFELRKISYK